MTRLEEVGGYGGNGIAGACADAGQNVLAHWILEHVL